MKLEPEIVRDILLYLEEAIVMTDNGETEEITVTDITKALKEHNYSRANIMYTCIRLKEAGYIIADFLGDSRHIENSYIWAITFEGHEYLDTIRNNTVWNKTKKYAKKCGIQTLAMIAKIAEAVATSKITELFP